MSIPSLSLSDLAESIFWQPMEEKLRIMLHFRIERLKSCSPEELQEIQGGIKVLETLLAIPELERAKGE